MGRRTGAFGLADRLGRIGRICVPRGYSRMLAIDCSDGRNRLVGLGKRFRVGGRLNGFGVPGRLWPNAVGLTRRVGGVTGRVVGGTKPSSSSSSSNVEAFRMGVRLVLGVRPGLRVGAAICAGSIDPSSRRPLHMYTP